MFLKARFDEHWQKKVPRLSTAISLCSTNEYIGYHRRVARQKPPISEKNEDHNLSQPLDEMPARCQAVNDAKGKITK